MKLLYSVNSLPIWRNKSSFLLFASLQSFLQSREREQKEPSVHSIRSPLSTRTRNIAHSVAKLNIATGRWQIQKMTLTSIIFHRTILVLTHPNNLLYLHDFSPNYQEKQWAILNNNTDVLFRFGLQVPQWLYTLSLYYIVIRKNILSITRTTLTESQ